MKKNKKDLEAKYLQKINDLISEGGKLTTADSRSRSVGANLASSTAQYSMIYGWVGAATVLVHSIIGNDNHLYCTEMNKQLQMLNSYQHNAYTHAGAAHNMLLRIKSDIEDGLIGDLESTFTAETFDDFLSHAEEYLKESRKMESGVIAGIVFEDTIRKIAKKIGIEGLDKPLENLINALKTNGHIEKTKASRCKVASTVRGTAAHANWDELDIGAVRDTIALTRELLGDFLEG